VTKIHRKVVKQGKRNAVYRFILAKGDKEKIVSWKQDLARVLQVFNVRRSVSWVFTNLPVLFQTELAIDTHMMVTDTKAVVVNTRKIVKDTQVVVANTQTMIADAQVVVSNTQATVADTHVLVADIHRKVLTGQGGTSNENHSVCVARFSSTREYLPSFRFKPGQ
jgi:hypothetical protein